MIVQYKFQEQFDLSYIMMRLVDCNKLETAKMLINHDKNLKIELIKALSTNDNCKTAAKLIKDFNFDSDDFPEVKERIMKKSIRYFLGRNLYKDKHQQEFLTLDRVEDLITGFKQMMSYLVEDLQHQNKSMEAKGMMIRHQIETYLRPEVLESLKAVEYDEKLDTSLMKYDAFEPLSRPINEYMELPKDVKLEWIGTDEDVPKLEILLKDEFIGVDSEWRPQLT